MSMNTSNTCCDDVPISEENLLKLANANADLTILISKYENLLQKSSINFLVSDIPQTGDAPSNRSEISENESVTEQLLAVSDVTNVVFVNGTGQVGGVTTVATGGTIQGAQGSIGSTGPAGVGLQGSQGTQGATVGNANGTQNFVSKFTNTTTLSNSLIFDNGVNIGVGTTNPTSNFHIIGTANVSQNLTVGQTLTVNGGSVLRSNNIYTSLIGDGANTVYIITHNLNATSIFTETRNVSSGSIVYPDIDVANTNSVNVSFSIVPAINEYRLSIFAY